MKQRIFVAIPISPELQAKIRKWTKKISALPVRWLAGKNLHITLVPPWYEENAVGVVEKLKLLVMGVRPFEIRFERVTFGPDPRRPRLIWAQGKTVSQITELRARIIDALGAKEEERPFRLHLTLARFKPETFSSFPIQRLDERVHWRDHVRSFVIMESHLFPDGADYEALAEIPLEVIL